MIFYDELVKKVQEGKRYGYTLADCATLWGIKKDHLRYILIRQAIPPEVQPNLVKNFDKEFDPRHDIYKYPYLLEFYESKYAYRYLQDTFIGLPFYSFSIYYIEPEKLKKDREEPKHKIVLNTLKVELLIRKYMKSLIERYNLDFLNKADSSLKCPAYMKELVYLVNINLTEFYIKMGVKDGAETKDIRGSQDFGIIDTASFEFKPSKIVKGKL